jgi:hypothetical protein
MEENVNVWEINDFKVDDLRRRMGIERELYGQKHPNASETTISKYLNNLFKDESFCLIREQMSIISEGLRRKS